MLAQVRLPIISPNALHNNHLTVQRHHSAQPNSILTRDNCRFNDHHEDVGVHELRRDSLEEVESPPPYMLGTSAGCLFRLADREAASICLLVCWCIVFAYVFKSMTSSDPGKDGYWCSADIGDE